MDEYQQNLERCSTEMLHYEWAWLNEHIEALELSLVQPEMCKELGGPGQAKNLLEENKEYQMLLQDYFRLRMIHPVSSRYPISPGEHAWELSNESIKEAWGIG